ncbi:hypothetical protein E2C01_081315 [Portunus trituberculatus]|uniref:Uncharacterized protein n=1 Tax=Portunus trituberculatus TaxID=210409 RepID=A0A5B7IVH5_PORTR|nr:hypothetical protein [Portunus trituberculatus]
MAPRWKVLEVVVAALLLLPPPPCEKYYTHYHYAMHHHYLFDKHIPVTPCLLHPPKPHSRETYLRNTTTQCITTTTITIPKPLPHIQHPKLEPTTTTTCILPRYIPTTTTPPPAGTKRTTTTTSYERGSGGDGGQGQSVDWRRSKRWRVGVEW